MIGLFVLFALSSEKIYLFEIIRIFLPVAKMVRQECEGHYPLCYSRIGIMSNTL